MEYINDPAIRKAARDAIQVQDACNLSGVVHAWDRAMGALWEVAHRDGKGTDWVNRHPICKLFAFKAALLARVPGAEHIYGLPMKDDEEFQRDYEFVHGIALGATRQAMAEKAGA